MRRLATVVPRSEGESGRMTCTVAQEGILVHRASLARCSGFRCALATLMLVLPLYGAGRAWAALVPSAPVGSALPLASTVVNSLPRYGEYVHVDELPEILTQVPPVYPEAARRAGVEGYVQVRVLVGRDGLVKDIRVERSIPALDSAAVADFEVGAPGGALRSHRLDDQSQVSLLDFHPEVQLARQHLPDFLLTLARGLVALLRRLLCVHERCDEKRQRQRHESGDPGLHE